MRRIIHNTTAIAACLSLLAPHLAMAQTAPSEVGTEQQPAEAVDGAVCEDGSEATCPAPAEPVEAQPAEDAAPADEATADAEPAPDVAAEGAADAEAALENALAEQTEDAQPDDAAVEAEIQPQGDDMTADAPAEPQAETAPDEAAVADDGAAEMPIETEDAGTEEAAPSGDVATDDDALAEALAQEAAEGEAAAEAAAGVDDGGMTDAEPEAAASGAATADPETQEATTPSGDVATDEDALAEALARKAAEDEAAAETAAGDDSETTTDGDAQPAASAAATADSETQADAPAPEEGVRETDAAREAAEASEAPTAAALSEEAGDAEITEEQVTEENSRSSDEDFATSLRDALDASTGQEQAPARAEGDDDKSDLTKALLLGAGALAVGAMLNNNRQVELSTPDRVVVTRPDGSQQVIKDEVALLRQPGSTVTTENFADGSSRTIVTRADGSKVVTIRDADLRVLRRTLVAADGSTVRLIDDTAAAQPVDISRLPAPAPVADGSAGRLNEEQLRAALLRETSVDRRFTLAQIRDIPQVRALVAPVNINAITFDTGSAAIKPDQANQLSGLGNVIRDSIARNPREMFLIEGHTDTVGSDAANLALSDRRAESVALALAEYFDVPPENMVVQGYGEQFLKIREEGDVRENRRASVRRITDLLQSASN